MIVSQSCTVPSSCIVLGASPSARLGPRGGRTRAQRRKHMGSVSRSGPVNVAGVRATADHAKTLRRKLAVEST